jgi:RNA polymerase-binding transcription factor DksA
LPDYDAKEVEARLKSRLEEIEATLARVTVRADESDAELADYDQHEGDQGTETYEQELDETRVAILGQERSLVQQALQRLAEGKYGICVDCGKEIPADRLKAMPEAIRCLEDQRRFEATHSGETLPSDIP